LITFPPFIAPTIAPVASAPSIMEFSPIFKFLISAFLDMQANKPVPPIVFSGFGST
jgi:hypothetical protein